MAPQPINLPQPSKGRAMIMMATKTDFLKQVVPKGRCTRKKYNGEYKVIGKTELKYETQRQGVEAEAQTRTAKSARSRRPCNNGCASIILNPTCKHILMTSKEAIAQPGWGVVVDTESPSPTGTNATVTFMNACLTAKTISFIQSPTSIKAANGFKYPTRGFYD